MNMQTEQPEINKNSDSASKSQTILLSIDSETSNHTECVKNAS